MDHLSFALTSDGSKTLFNEQVGENYHSRHGALQESKHVFLNSGLCFYLEKETEKKASVLEVGFGTGLNFLVTADHCLKNEISLNYTGIEAYPLNQEMIAETGYQEYVSEELWNSFLNNYSVALNRNTEISSACSLRIAHKKLLDFRSEELFDVIYFDAFAAVHQPEMWNPESLNHICKFLKPGGVFVTYAITGDLKRTMKSLGFSIEKAPGAAGKREMLRAVKL
ncbi:tRNA U34 5-methylaminomethyl-2-thiouridine-forming methyltransferase MnmC [Daejeonella rubra]|uniref:tRNA U34 5-methylaminomethyl-2-thiouridine-forming methyltransferase MnmC n=1 Tax=Daejeonella rubra TaxID=990371 RepID=A0A1G9P6X7_9SPHI|nr:tRNA (5-methylaminomethyl-2-thiouridine)(34)-methyltransferase MnmD [Daejeonella rubra]SDL94536.1 tRNA U34 5-methylaminomethyl-2-thiouridine-forming methyltransferase MnmC [Daejeonella rubra]